MGSADRGRCSAVTVRGYVAGTAVRAGGTGRRGLPGTLRPRRLLALPGLLCGVRGRRVTASGRAREITGGVRVPGAGRCGLRLGSCLGVLLLLMGGRRGL